MLSLLIAVVIAALIFDYINGFHDAANAIATSVATGVLPMRTAVILAGIFNIVGAMYGTEVAKTLASGFADPKVVTQQMVLAALIGASAWNLITWWWGIPSSSSHALIGGLAGAVVAGAGAAHFNWATLGGKVMVPLVLSPVIGFFVALVLMVLVQWVVRRMRPAAVNRGARRMQLVSACAMAFSHGSNDAQKVMGIITLSLVSYLASGGHLAEGIGPVQAEVAGKMQWQVPLWVKWACALAIGFGTMAGGKRIIKTMGAKIIKITPLQGFAAETAGTATILSASHLGIPVSTTHCINACIMGVGASHRLAAVRWAVAGKILIAWVVTLPCSAAIAWLAMELIRLA